MAHDSQLPRLAFGAPSRMRTVALVLSGPTVGVLTELAVLNWLERPA